MTHRAPRTGIEQREAVKTCNPPEIPGFNEQTPPRRADPQPPVRAVARRIPPAAPHSARFDAAGLADAVRDVLEHAARVGKTVAFADLCAQVKALGELPESDQVQVLRRVKPTARPRSPKPQSPDLLTALISTEAGTMHPIYRQLANHAGHHLPQQASSLDRHRQGPSQPLPHPIAVGITIGADGAAGSPAAASAWDLAAASCRARTCAHRCSRAHAWAGHRAHPTHHPAPPISAQPVARSLICAGNGDAHGPGWCEVADQPDRSPERHRPG